MMEAASRGARQADGWFDGAVIGVLPTGATREVSSSARRLLEAVGNQTAVAIERVTLAADIDQASRSMKELTALSGRQAQLPARVTVRIFNDHGILLMESSVKPGSGGGS